MFSTIQRSVKRHQRRCRSLRPCTSMCCRGRAEGHVRVHTAPLSDPHRRVRMVWGATKPGCPATIFQVQLGRSTMKHHMQMALMAGLAAGAWVVSSDRGYTQATADPNAAPNPYTMQDNWLQLPQGRQL